MLNQALAVSFIFLARKRSLLDLDTRRHIYEFVHEYPGMHLSEIARALDLETNHAKYHLQYLEDHGIMSSRKDEGYWRFFPKAESPLGPKEVLDRRDKDALAMLRRPVPLHITLLLLDRVESTHSQLLAEVDVSASTLHYHLSKMERAGLLVSRKEGRERYYQITDAEHVTDMLMRYQPPDRLVQGFLEAWEQLELVPGLREKRIEAEEVAHVEEVTEEYAATPEAFERDKPPPETGGKKEEGRGETRSL